MKTLNHHRNIVGIKSEQYYSVKVIVNVKVIVKFKVNVKV